MHTLVEPLYAADLYPWSETAGFVNVVLNLMTEEEPTGKMLRVYKQKKKRKRKTKTTLEVKCMCPQQHTIPTKLWTYRICCFHFTVTVCDLWTAPTVNVNEYLNCDKQKTE